MRTSKLTAVVAMGTSAASVILLGAAASARQAAPQAASVVNRMNSAYRSLHTYYDKATITQKLGKKEVEATLTLAMQRPNRYLLELKGEHLNTVILSDGAYLIALRPDRKAYTKLKAPQLIMNSDLMGSVDMPSLGARIISQLLSATVREGEIGRLLLNAKVTGPEGFGDKLAYVFTFPYGDDTEAKIYVTSDDYMVKQVKIIHSGSVDWLEVHDKIEADKPVPAETFVRPLPDGAAMVTTLPPLEKTADLIAASESQDPDVGDMDSTTLARSAKTIFRVAGCSRCHTGGKAPDLSHEGADAEHTEKWIADHIKDPASQTPGSTMPAFKTKLSERNINVLAKYLASLK